MAGQGRFARRPKDLNPRPNSSDAELPASGILLPEETLGWSKMAYEPTSDDRALADLAARYTTGLHAFFVRRVRDAREAEDLTQEVFRALLRRSQLHEIENLEGYVFRVAASVLAQKARSARRRPNIHYDGDAAMDWLAPDELSPERVLLSREAYATFVRALQELPERTRTVFVLNRFEAMTGREIAHRLRCSVSTVEKDMIRAIAHLKERLS